MSSFNIPPKETKRWTGPYLGSYYGSLWKTYNVDFDKNEGKVILSRRFERIEDTTEIAGDNPYGAFLRTNADSTDRYWALRIGGTLIKTDSATPENSVLPSADWDTDGLDSTPQACRDFTVHSNDSRNDSGKNKLFVTTDSGDIAVLNDTGNGQWTGSWWVTKQSQPALSTSTLRTPIQYFPFRKISLIGDGNLVHTISRPSDTQNDTITYARLTLPKNLNIRHILTTVDRAWFLCAHRYGGEGAVIEWDGYTESYNQIHSIYGVAAISGINYKETPIVINNNGAFLEYNGRGFQSMIRDGQEVGFPMMDDKGSTLLTGSDTSVATAIAPRGMTVGEDGLIYINTGQANIISERYSAGIWCLNPLTGRLYNKYSLGRWGDSLDYGHQYIHSPGGIYYVPSSVSSRNLLVGGRIFTTDTSTPETGIWLQEANTSTTVTRGYFITQFVPAENIRELWDNLWLRFRRFLSSSSSIIVKARGVRSLYLANRQPLSATITWTSTTTFTVTLASADDSLLVGDEVEIIGGRNSGWLAHITTISGAHAALQTITIDETVTTGSGSSVARFDRWKKLGTISNTDKYEDNLNIGIQSSFIQFKAELRAPATDMEFSDIIVNYETNIYNKK